MFGSLAGIDLVLVFVSLVIAIVVHEMMHGVVAFWLGDDTAAEAGRLTLNPLKSIDPVATIILPLIVLKLTGLPIFAAKPVPFNPNRVKWEEYGVALVGLAGPATNLVLALIGAGLYHVTGDGTLLQNFAYYFTAINIGIMVFNLIPFPPLDGSRVLYAFAPEPVQEIMERIEAMGFIVVLLIILVLFQFIAPVIQGINSDILRLLIG